MSLTPALKHLFAPPWIARRAFPRPALERIEAAIKASEQRHRGEIRFAVEAALEFLAVLRGLTPRERALEVFSLLRVWDTEENTGVLIYLLWADHAVEIIADRAANRSLPDGGWLAICDAMAQACREGRHVDGVVAAIGAVNQALQAALPAKGPDRDELPNRAIVI